MAKLHPLEVVLFLTVVAVSSGQSIRTATTYPQQVEIGTFSAADKTCFLKKIFKGQPSPATYDFVAGTDITYGTAVTMTRNSLGGVTAAFSAAGPNSIFLKVAEAADEDIFLNDIRVTLRCAPV